MKRKNLKNTYACIATAVLLGQFAAVPGTIHAAENDSKIEEFAKKPKKHRNQKEATKWAKTTFKKWNNSLTVNQKKLLSDAKSIEKMNQDIEKYRGNLASLPEDSKTNMDMMDTAFKLDSAKLGEALEVHKNLKIKDLGYHMESFYKPGTTTIDIGKVTTKLKTDFKYGMINNFMEAHLAEPENSSADTIQLVLEIPEGTRVAHTDSDQILIDRNYGIEVTKEARTVVHNGKDVTRVNAKLVPKQKIEEKIKAIETTINKKFNLDKNLFSLDMNGFYSSTALDRANRLVDENLIKTVPNYLLAEITDKMNSDGSIILTDKDLININSNAPKDAKSFYDHKQKKLYINLNHPDHINQLESALNPILHEFSKVVDEKLVTDTVLSNTEEFKKIYEQEKKGLEDVENYTNEKEFFSAVFKGIYSTDKDKQNTLKKKVPQAVEYITQKINGKTYVNGINVSKGKEAVEGSGLVPEHIDKFKQVSKDLNTYIFFRPVNKLATSLIKNGAATKGMNVHGKSSDWGPAAGYIPLDQDLSKKHGKKGAVEDGNKANKESLEKHKEDINKIPLRIDQARINELEKEDILKIGEKVNENGKTFSSLITKNEIYEFRINTSSDEVEYRTKPGKTSILGESFGWKKVEVMAKNINGDSKPLTADYDMFALAPGLQEIKKRIPTDEWEQAVTDKKPLEKLKNITNLLIKYGLERKSDTEKGSLTQWQKEMIDDLNTAAKDAGYTGGTVVNHGTEQDNIDFPEKDDEIFVVTPDGQLILTKSWDDTRKFVEANVVKKGYLYYFNRSYNKVAKGNKAQIEWTDPITKEKTVTIPTRQEFFIKLGNIRKDTKQGVSEDDKGNHNLQVRNNILEIAQCFTKYYNPTNNLLAQERKYKISIYRGIEALETIQRLLDSNQINPNYNEYFNVLKKQVENQVQLLLEYNKFNISLKDLYDQMNKNKNENEDLRLKYLEEILSEK
ncbi:anthrax toxin-like adenylyl cyclase domain-containing protein [Bacillus cereus]|uniref:anthrax toxin-like adenylyl cyclase domain-containing protein n=1 Tax=Bacillus cereus TaxID=1396 RepID=UPI00159676F7|nr:anthrax toxin-like adenylyl cyclase domain-containing protein [Bacillus cereus]